MKPARRTQAERSEEMRTRLADSAYKIIAERGHSAFRTANVAALAGVSQGAMLHHFPTKDAVTLAAIEHAFGLATASSEDRLALSPETIEAAVLLMLEDFIAFFSGDRFWVSLDITMDALKNETVAPQIRTIVSQHRRPIYQKWADKLAKLGWTAESAAEAVQLAAALVSGLAIRTLWTSDEDMSATAHRWIPLILETGKFT